MSMTWSGIGNDGWDGTPCPDDLYLTSASSVAKALAAPSLETWRIGEIVDRLHERLPEFTARYTNDPDDTKKWASQLHWEPKAGAELNAADTGTLMHALLEAWLRGLKPDDQIADTVGRDPVLVQLATNLWGWFNRFKPEAVAIEQVVYGPALGIAGRLDMLVRFPSLPRFGVCLVDLKNARDSHTKSGARKRPFGDSHALQLRAYRSCDLTATFEPRVAVTKRATRDRTYLLNPREQAVCAPATEIASTFILHNTPLECVLYPIDTGPAVERRLIEVLGAGRWLKEECRHVVGAPVPPPITLPDLTA